MQWDLTVVMALLLDTPIFNYHHELDPLYATHLPVLVLSQIVMVARSLAPLPVIEIETTGNVEEDPREEQA